MTSREAMKLRSQAFNAMTDELETKDPVLFTVCASLVCALDRFVERASPRSTKMSEAEGYL